MILAHSAAAAADPLVEHLDRMAVLLAGPVHEYVARRLPGRGGRAVDLGCGTGVHTALLADRYADVLAVDVCEPALEVARRTRARAAVRYQRRDMRDVRPATDGTFDLVFSAFALHEVDDLDAALRGVRALVRPGGRVLLLDDCDEPRDAAQLRARARRELAVDVLTGRRPAGQARELYRLRTDPTWLDRQLASRPLPPGEFERRYCAVLRQAVVTPLGSARGVQWLSPG